MLHKIAFNPLPWYVFEDGWHPERAPALDHILKAIKEAGYSAVHAEVPAGKTPREYKAMLDAHGLAPAPGYVSVACSDPANHAAAVDTARRAAAEHAELGLDRMFLAEKFGDAPQRFSRPAQAVDADPARLARIIDGFGLVSEAMKQEGVMPCLHQHVATWIESIAETEAILEAIPSSVLLLGADTGHLTWAGADTAAFIKRHRDRLGAVHIKDMRKSVAAAVAAEGLSYFAASSGRHIWTEPGRGDIDFAALLDAIKPYDGWYVIEVDFKDQPTVEESARISLTWLVQRLEGAGQ